MTPIQATGDGIRLSVHVQPRASRTEVAGLHGDAIKLRIAAPPVDGAANDEVVRFLAELLRIPKRQITIATGQTGRRKTVDVIGVDPATAATALGLG